VKPNEEYAPYRPKEAFGWLERFRDGYRIIRTRARFIPGTQCDPQAPPDQCDRSSLLPSYWNFSLFIHFRDGTYGCFGMGLMREGTAYRFWSLPLSLGWSTTDLKSLPPHIKVRTVVVKPGSGARFGST
jgi:hypothetical protein